MMDDDDGRLVVKEGWEGKKRGEGKECVLGGVVVVVVLRWWR